LNILENSIIRTPFRAIAVEIADRSDGLGHDVNALRRAIRLFVFHFTNSTFSTAALSQSDRGAARHQVGAADQFGIHPLEDAIVDGKNIILLGFLHAVETGRLAEHAAAPAFGTGALSP
jgi:hypothetical protein